MCEFAPKEVYPHISMQPAGYSLDRVLATCRKFQIDDATAYLLERTGDVAAALELTLQSVNKAVSRLRAHVDANWTELAAQGNRIDDAHLHPVKEVISMAILLCQRSMESEPLWFGLLDRFFAFQRQLKDEYKRKPVPINPDNP
jgi:hypothetical protein